MTLFVHMQLSVPVGHPILKVLAEMTADTAPTLVVDTVAPPEAPKPAKAAKANKKAEAADAPLPAESVTVKTAVPVAEAPKAEAPKAEPKTDPGSLLTRQQVAGVVQKAVQVLSAESVQAIFAKAGFQRLKEVPDEKLAMLVAALNKGIEAKAAEGDLLS